VIGHQLMEVELLAVDRVVAELQPVHEELSLAAGVLPTQPVGSIGTCGAGVAGMGARLP
jgi:hypothetical protein